MTEDDIVERGITAEYLLADATFQSFTEEYKELLKASIMAADERQDRDKLFYEHKALDGLIGTMQAYVAAKNQIAAKRDAEQQLAREQQLTMDIDYQ